MTQEPLDTPTSENTATSGINKPLHKLIRTSLEYYFAQIDKNMPPQNVYRMVMEETEIPLLEATLAYTQGNQCQMAKILGISRSTLRKKLSQHHLLNK